ncbi:hypothetical protein CDD81_121 [Ophiocordyceps australis]|uniref:Uncharacterized protein n=1 Tax=Ophiocordyceps australis TaxID=1399860 RepID=A0A2C5YK46_9HYPO|nr:hypothetical protein CDD81_121 [Ophiocordyceps australis]
MYRIKPVAPRLLGRPSRGVWSRRVSSVSLSCGPSLPALSQETLASHFASIVSRHGERPALITRTPTPADSPSGFAERRLTYAALDTLSNRLSWSLAALGVEHGTRVAVSLGNGAEFAALSYAVYKLGAVLVPLNPSFSARQLGAALRHLGVRVLVVGAVTDLAYKPGRGRSNEGLLRDLLAEGGELSGQREVACREVPTLRSVVVVDNGGFHPDVDFDPTRYACLTNYQHLVAAGSVLPPRPSRRLDARDTVNIQFTSGTTAMPKAAMLSHASMLNNGILISRRMRLDCSDRLVVPPPLFHCFGSVLGFLACVDAGAACLFPSPAFDAHATLHMCRAHHATGLHGVPTMYAAVLDALAHAHAPPPPLHLVKGIAAGSAVPEALLHSIRQRLGLRDLVIAYGMTETSPVSCMTSPDDPPAMRFSSIGKVMPHTAVKIVDPSNRNCILPRNQPGELAAAGYLVMQGYYADAQRTAAIRVAEPNHAALPDSFLRLSRGPAASPHDAATTWVYSGDEAVMSPDGFVRITGRIKDLIIRGGENIHPAEIENCLLQHPAVSDAAVVGVPDSRLGEAVAACVVLRSDLAAQDDRHAHSSSDSLSHLAPAPPASSASADKKPTAAELRDWVKSHLSSHLVPKHVFCIRDLPKTASGKVQKYKLREMAAHALRCSVGDAKGSNDVRNDKTG